MTKTKKPLSKKDQIEEAKRKMDYWMKRCDSAGSFRHFNFWQQRLMSLTKLSK